MLNLDTQQYLDFCFNVPSVQTISEALLCGFILGGHSTGSNRFTLLFLSLQDHNTHPLFPRCMLCSSLCPSFYLHRSVYLASYLFTLALSRILDWRTTLIPPVSNWPVVCGTQIVKQPKNMPLSQDCDRRVLSLLRASSFRLIPYSRILNFRSPKG